MKTDRNTDRKTGLQTEWKTDRMEDGQNERQTGGGTLLLLGEGPLAALDGPPLLVWQRKKAKFSNKHNRSWMRKLIQ